MIICLKEICVWMGQIYSYLGLSVAAIEHEASYLYDDSNMEKTKGVIDNVGVEEDYLRPVSRKEAYQADITYGTNNEFGFDYLRDHMAPDQDKVVQRPHHFAIVDEVDLF